MPIDLDELERLEREATPGPWKIATTKFASGDGWYVVDAHGDFIAGANAPNPSTDEPNTRCVAAARNALPDLIVELRTLRARVAELERDLDACRVDHADEAYDQGRRDALRGVQGACLFEMGKLELIPMEYRGPSWDWEGYPEEMRMHEAFDRVAEAAEEAAR